MGKVMRVRFCHDCNVFQPPRSTHCYDCKNCVLEWDHHCPWVGALRMAQQQQQPVRAGSCCV